MKLNDYLDDMPALHTWDRGKTWNTGGFDRHQLEPIHQLIGNQPGLSFIETGAGNSTIFFLLHEPSRVCSIAPDAALFDRIDAYCASHGISEDTLERHIEGSQWALPALAASAPLFDFGLIDGDHNWPMVFVDFFYVNYLVRAGGLIMVDDVQLHSVAELSRLLKEQPGYEVALELSKSVIFRKLTDARELPGFGHQPYIVRPRGHAPWKRIAGLLTRQR